MGVLASVRARRRARLQRSEVMDQQSVQNRESWDTGSCSLP